MVRDVVRHRAGHGVLAHRAGALPTEARAEDRSQRHGGVCDSWGAAVDVAPVVAGDTVSDHAQQAASVLVEPAAASVLLCIGDCGWIGHDHLRILDEFEVLWPLAVASHFA